MNEKSDESIRDVLTGVYSRSTLDERLEEEIRRSQRYNMTFSLLFIDIDHFKSINDGFGHTRGDEVLIEFANRLQNTVRETDFVFRHGGDEFVILLPFNDKDQAVILAQRLLDIIRDKPFEGTPPLSLGMSIGVVSFPQDATNAEEIVSTADQRHYQAKRSGRGRIISEGMPLVEGFVLEEPSRLLSRDFELKTLHQYLDDLTTQASSTMQVAGENFVGKTRFLAEAQRFASLRNYAVLKLNGRQALRRRFFGVLNEALSQWEELKIDKTSMVLPHPAAGVESFERALIHLLSRKKRSGLLITLDNWTNLDQATRGFLQDMLPHGLRSQFPVGLIFAVPEKNIGVRLLNAAPMRLSIQLDSLSEQDLRIWVRQALQWEASNEFLTWLYQETRGLPGLIQRGLYFLLEKELIHPIEGSNWGYDSSLLKFPLAHQVIESAVLPPHNLPSAPSDFVGRDEELFALENMIRDHHLVNLTGSGGTGKTRLALQAAAESLENFRDGVFFVSLNGVHSLSVLTTSIAGALQFTFSWMIDPKKQMIDYLHHRSLLLVLDNFEHIFEGTALLSEILEKAPDVHILVTSRGRLNLPEEVLYTLGGLPYPPHDNDTTPESYSAVQLFLQSARRTVGDFTVPLADKPYMTRICRQVEGTPLGIELAAAWVQMYSCREIAEQITKSLNFLENSPPGEDASRSLLAILDSFWSLLFEPEQAVLSRLSTLRGGFKPEAAGIIAGASPFFLDGLISKSYLHRMPQERFRIHELLQQYAEKKLHNYPHERLEARSRHCDYYLSALKKWGEALKGKEQKFALSEIQAEIENIRKAWRWGIENGRVVEVGSALEGLFYFYYMRSYFNEGEEAFAYLINIASEKQAPEMDNILGHAFAAHGWFAFLRGQHGQARLQIERGLVALRHRSSTTELSFALNYLGAILQHLGEYDSANATLNESLAICRSNRLDFNASIALNALGHTALLQGNLDQAYQYLNEAMHLKQDCGDRWGMGFIKEYMGQLAYQKKQYTEARQLLEESLAIRRDTGDLRGIALGLVALVDVAMDQQDYGAGRILYEEAMSNFQAAGNLLGIMQSTNALGNVLLHLEETRRAQYLFLNATKTGVCCIKRKNMA